MKRLEGVIVLEELDPYLEHEIKSLAGENGLALKTFGKEEGYSAWEEGMYFETERGASFFQPNDLSLHIKV